jgi:hypothetical protein
MVKVWVKPEPELGDRETIDGGTSPEPVRLTVCGAFAALSVMVSVAVSVAAVEGLNVMLIVQFLLAASEEPQVVAEWAKSAELVPLMARSEMVIALLLLLFVSVTALAALLTPTC